MSFCAELKNELALIRPSECCKQPLAYGFMLFGRSFSIKRISMQTNNENIAKAYASAIYRAFGVRADISKGGTERPTYKAEVSSEADRLKILASFDYGIADNLINTDILTRECCFQSFIRGAFLACGNINDPEKEYRIEFIIKNENTTDELLSLLLGYGISLKKAKRGSTTVLYTKESSSIEDLLTLMGAGNRTLDIINTKIVKSFKNDTNRRSNCDNANISKTVEASFKQRRAIEYLRKTEKISNLPEELLRVADLREKYPESSLKELAALSEDKITVSSLNNRLNKIIEIYEELKSK